LAGPPPKTPERRQRRNARTTTGRESALVALPGGRRRDVPAPPPGLLKPAKDRWQGFWGSEVARAVDPQSDLPALERWVKATDEYDRVARVVKRSRLVRGSMGQPVAHPLLSYLGQLEGQISKAEAAFGMTPIARLRLGIALGEAARSLESLNEELEADDDDDPRADPATWPAAVVADARPAGLPVDRG
jgi:P27 family predicted phage terminase small subunit